MTKIVVVTHERAGRVLTRRLFDDPDRDMQTCVPEGQLDAYREHDPDATYLVHPDDVVGLIAKRQWIYDTLGDVFMLDDDVDMVQRMDAERGEDTRIRGDQLIGVIERLEDTAKQLGLAMYGFPAAGNPMSYKPQRPFRFNGVVQGHCFGMIRDGSRLWYHPEIVGTEVDWLVCLNAYEHRIMLMDTRYGFNHRDTFTAPGGLQGIRTRATMERDVEILRTSFGDQVIQKVSSKDTSFANHLGFRLVLPWK